MEVSQGQLCLSVLYCLAEVALIATSLNITTVHYIVPALSSCPEGRECTDIWSLLNESERYFTSNTKVIFQPGTYIINSSINKSIIVYNVNDLVISGDSTTGGGQRTNSKVTLLCQAQFNIIIVQSENVHIDNLELLQCGASIEPSNFHKRVLSSVYRFIRLSDVYRKEIANLYSQWGSTTRIIKHNFTNIYILHCRNVTIENTLIERALAGVTFISVNIYGHFIISGCSFKGIYRAWYIDKYIHLAFVTGLFHTIKNSLFFSRVSGNNEQQEQEAVTVIDHRTNNNLQTWLTVHFVIENTTIQGQASAKGGYILNMILGTPVFSINLNKLKSYKGKQQIITPYTLRTRPSAQIRVIDSEFRDQSSLVINSLILTSADLLIVIKNLLISDAVDSLRIPRCTAYLCNVTVEGTRHTAISLYQTRLFFEGYNRITSCNAQTALSTAGYYAGGLSLYNSTVTFRGVMHFDSNSGEQSGAISAKTASTLIFEGKIIFTDNTGFDGGAIGLHMSSLIIINHTATVSFIRNHALNYGGAIYIDDNYPLRKVINEPLQCFYEPAEWDYSIDYHVLNFVNNTAGEAGDTIFAVNGEYDFCDFPNNNKTSEDFPFHSFVSTLESYPSNISVSASKAKRICFCTNSRPNCTYVRDSKEVCPGQDIKLSLVAVGNGYGTVPATIQARIHNGQQANGSVLSQPHLSNLQTTQVSTKYCTRINYTIYSYLGNHTLLLSLHQILLKDALFNIQDFEEDPELNDPSVVDYEIPLLITLSLKECPVGFQLSQESQSCICHSKLRKNNIGCNINDQTVYRQQSHWLGADYNDVLNEHDVVIYKYCPFDYCQPESMNLSLDNQDEQCSNQRSGVLCGQCQGNLSMVLGTTSCIECSHIWILLILPLSILAGVILVVILTILNLTVAIGTFSGLIFYANIVQTNKAVLFPPLTENIANLSQFSKTFIAWLNLDLGIEVCFYEGLDTYAKALFQFMFPVYIWTIMIIIIVSSHYSTRVAKLTGRNAVQVLATLFLLSYSKILRGIITALSVTTLDYPNESKLVWLPDGNVDYLKGKHIFLFLLALFLLTVLSVPYTSILLFSQCLQRWNFKVISWIWKVKPMFDAYTGPFKDKHRYWTGLLLLVRVVLYIVYSTNVGGDPAVNLLATCITVICLLTYLVLAGGVYKSWPLTILECSYLLNISVLMAVALYSRLTDKNQDIFTNISVMVSFLLACGTVVYHVYLRIKGTRLVKRYIQHKKQTSRRNEQTEEGEGLIELQEATKKETVPVTSQEFHFDKLINQQLLEGVSTRPESSLNEP